MYYDLLPCFASHKTNHQNQQTNPKNKKRAISWYFQHHHGPEAITDANAQFSAVLNDTSLRAIFFFVCFFFEWQEMTHITYTQTHTQKTKGIQKMKELIENRENLSDDVSILIEYYKWNIDVFCASFVFSIEFGFYFFFFFCFCVFAYF